MGVLNALIGNVVGAAAYTLEYLAALGIEEAVIKSYFLNYTRSHIMWLQAYDLLKASAKLPELDSIKYYDNYNSDADISWYSPRNKLRKNTSNIYKMSKGPLGIVTHVVGWKKNHGIACASALITASIVLNDAGVKKRLRWNYSPENWYEFGTEGLYENLFDGKRFLASSIPMAPKKFFENEYSPYAEGPNYCAYGLMDCGVPAMRSQQNFLPSGSSDAYLKKHEFNNIFNWLHQISVGNILMPTYDNTKPNELSWLLALTNNSDFNYGGFDAVRSQTSDYVALIGGNDIPSSNLKKNNADNQLASVGNIILRNELDSIGYYFHMLAEDGIATDRKSLIGGTHEEDDLGSFMIYAGKITNRLTPLGIDPPYFGWKLVENTNKYWMHNVVEIDNGSPAKHREYKYPKPVSITESSTRKEFTLAYDFIDTYFFNLLNGYYLDGNAIRRNVIEQKNGNYIYYFIRDYAEADVEEWPDFQGMKLNFNGYGKQGVNASFSSTGNLHSWTGACNTSGFKISSNHCALAGGRIGTVSWELPQEIDAEDGTRANMVEFGNKVTRLQVFQPNKRSTIFHSAYFPQRCQDSLPKVTEIDTFENKLATIIEMVSQVDTFPNPFGGKKQNPLVNDSITHLHIGKLTGQAADSLQNPLARHNTINKTLYFNGSTIFLESHTLEKVNKDFRFCPSANIRIRNYFSREGSYLILDDTLYHSSIPLNFEYDFLGKDKFQCRLTNLATPSSTDTLKIKLTGVTRGLDFIALIDNTRDTLHGRFDSIAGYIYLAIKPNNYSFTIQRKDPCSDCYFPPYGTDFDTLFVADDGLEHTLGQSKKINQGHGNLSILNATRISLCPGVILHNKDSIIIQSGNQKLPEPMSSCAGIDSIKKHSANSMLIVSPNAALVLDAGSRTYIKNGASLYVKQNGSLIIKSGALVEVGDSGTLGNSEIKAEPGAFIYIEDQANIRYRTNTKDTTDKRNTINFAIGNGGVNAGIKFPIDTILQNDSILANPYVAIPVCQLDSINPIGNPYWGYTNFAKPQIHLRTKKLTLCPNEKFHLSLNRILNDAQAKITVCRMDSIQKLDRHGVLIWQDTCINDSIVLDSMPPDPTCLRPRATPDQWSYQFPVNSLHRVSISLRNECNKAVDSTFEVLVLDTPTMSIQVPNFACEGYGTVWAVANINRTGPVHHAFEVIELPDSLNPGFSGYKPAEEFTFDTLAAIPDTFNFPNYYFRGGRNYLLSFTIIDACGTVTVEKVVSIPTGAYVQLSRPTVYANPIHGAKSLQLNGYVNQADSFSWYPQDYLNRTDTLQVISTPVDSMYYVLTAYKGSCIARDTAFIKYNRVANAGLQDTVCFTGTKTLVGNAYDLSIFLGFMYFKGGSTFRDDWFITRTTANSEYFKYLSLFMHTTQFKNWAQSSNLYNDFTEDLHRAQTIKTPWFINYFEQLTEFTDPNLYALDTFVYYVNLNQALKNNYQQTGDFQNYVSYLTGFFSLYEDFVANNLNSYNISWIKISDGDTSYNGSLQESAIAIDEPAKTSIYIQKVITPEYAEFDETIVYVDTVLEVAFVPQLQMDSTVVFQNLTIPTDGISAFEWDFGDGSPTATEVHAFHTFPAFDTLFRVCLTATNECGSYSWCDTVYIDSAHWGGSMFKQKLKAPTETVNAISQDGIEAILFPNPTEGNCTISYRIQGEATLVITDAGGRTVWETALQVNRGQQQIPSQTFEAGLYFYHISTNVGSIQGKFIVQK